jgi:hypothetical protein
MEGWVVVIVMGVLVYFAGKLSEWIQFQYDVSEIRRENERREKSGEAARERLHQSLEKSRIEREEKTRRLSMHYTITGTASLYERKNRYRPNDFYWYFHEIDKVEYNNQPVPFRMWKWNKNWHSIVSEYSHVPVEGPRKVRIIASAYTGKEDNPAPEYVVFYRSQANGLLEHWRPVGEGDGPRTLYSYQKNKGDYPEVRL